jgi:hypothetical protein
MKEEDSPQIRAFMKQIQQKLPVKVTVDAAAAAVVEDFETIGGPLSEESLGNLEIAKARVSAQLAPIEMVYKLSIVDPELTRWYTGPKPEDRHWPALRGYLESTKRWQEKAVRSIDRSSSEVVGSLADPNRARFSHKGLVVGYVQSGKTANMTAVIAKAVDAGYNFVIILAGVTNKLRAQTQRRIDADIRSRFPQLWVGYTSAHIAMDEDDTDTNGDFVIPPDRRFQMPAPGRIQYAVVKKEATRLEKLITTFEKSPRNTLEQLRILLIDDECDQASVNASSSDDGITRINEQLRRLIGLLPACSYVGYTATPFANVFINPFPAGDGVLDDLYPKHFITALPRPEGYVGTLEVFGSIAEGAEESGEDNDGRPMVRVVPKDEVSKLRSRPSQKSTFSPSITDSLERALLWFVASCAIRRLRGHADSHMTMLVHTSPYVIEHQRMKDAIRAWVDANQTALSSASGDIWQRFVSVFKEETTRVPLAPSGEHDLTPENLAPLIADVLAALDLVVENGISEERLDFTGGPKTYIVVGGSVLARGLTLEGLSVSFFLRTSKQYDTLLQMGRWFGFRQGYEDLPRLWATGDLIDAFRAIGRVEEEIRGDIARYVGNPGFTPLDFAVRVRQIPGLAITAAAKMRHAYQVAMSYAGRHVQTICFEHRNPDVIRTNWEAVKALASSCSANGREQKSKTGVKLFAHVPASAVLAFLRDYRIASDLELTSKSLMAYITGAGDALSSWNVAFVGPAKSAEQFDIPGVGPIGLNRRAKMKESSEHRADIKALMSKADILVDVANGTPGAKDMTWDELKEKRAPVPLLLVYPVDKHSPPKTASSKTREALNAIDHLPAIGLVFPGTREASGKYLAVNLEVEAPVLIDSEGSEPEEAEET